MLAAKHGLDPARIIYGNGSDEVLHLAAGAFAGPGDEVIFVHYGFAVYEIAARRVGAMPVVAPDNDYATDVDAILACVTERTKIVYIANPNNPTGTYASRDEIARLHAGLRRDILLVLDHAYAEYIEGDAEDGGMALAETASNVLVTRTFSKMYGLAAERIGWGYASRGDHRRDAPHPPALLDHHRRARRRRSRRWATRSSSRIPRRTMPNGARWFSDEIAKLGNAGLRAVPSQANFVLVLFEGALTAEAAYKGLMDAGYIVRWLPGPGPAARAAHHRSAPRTRCAGRGRGAARDGREGRLMLPFARVTIIGLGLIGSSIARAVKAHMPSVRVTGHDADPEVRDAATRARAFATTSPTRRARR